MKLFLTQSSRFYCVSFKQTPLDIVFKVIQENLLSVTGKLNRIMVLFCTGAWLCAQIWCNLFSITFGPKTTPQPWEFRKLLVSSEDKFSLCFTFLDKNMDHLLPQSMKKILWKLHPSHIAQTSKCPFLTSYSVVIIPGCIQT